MLVFTFPGQGSQRPGMGREWTDHPSWEVVGAASEVCGRDVAHLLLNASKEELTETRNAQLATFVLSLVVLDALERVGLEPGGVAGHSLGEYSALVASGAIGFDDGVRLVVERGEAMQMAAEENPGTMAAVIGISDDDAEAACLRAESEAWVANYNAPGQVVLAGSAEGLKAAGEIARSMGARKILPIPVGGAFHTPLMGPARDRLRKALAAASFSDPEVPIVANVDARTHMDGSEWPALLSAQLTSPVRWHQTLATFERMEARAFVEVGPGGVLVGLARRIVGDGRALTVAKPDDIDFLVGVLADGSPLQAYVGAHAGERVLMSERVVTAPASGVFEAAPAITTQGPVARSSRSGSGPALDGPTDEVAAGDLIGTISGVEVRTQFSGTLMGLLVLPGERVMAGQPVAWLRVQPD